MTAKEMFENLGYEKKEGIDCIGYFHNLACISIDFYIDKKTYSCNFMGSFRSIGIKEHKAITQQMKELGWLEDDR